MEKILFGESLDGSRDFALVLVLFLVLSTLHSAWHMAGCQSMLAK